MPLAQRLLLNVPLLPLGLIIIGGAVVLSVAGLLIVRRYISHQRLKTHNDVAGAIFGTFGVVYAVLLAFVVVIAWESFDKSALNVEKEASCLSDLCRDAQGLSEPIRHDACTLFSEYARAVVDEEWKMIARGQASARVTAISKRIWALYGNHAPKTDTEKVFFEESVHKLNELGELRQLRLLDARTGIHPVLWFVLIVGAMATVAFTFFFGTENLKAQIMMTTLLAALTALILFTILLFDYPFTGAVSVSADPFRQALVTW